MRCNKERLFDHPVGGSEQVRRDAEAECLGSLEIMTNRNFVGRCTGRSPGCSPLRKRLLDQQNLGLIRRDRGARQRWVRTACRPRHRSKKRFELIRYRVFTSLPGFIGLKLSNNFSRAHAQLV